MSIERRESHKRFELSYLVKTEGPGIFFEGYYISDKLAKDVKLTLELIDAKTSEMLEAAYKLGLEHGDWNDG